MASTLAKLFAINTADTKHDLDLSIYEERFVSSIRFEGGSGKGKKGSKPEGKKSYALLNSVVKHKEKDYDKNRKALIKLFKDNAKSVSILDLLLNDNIFKKKDSTFTIESPYFKLYRGITEHGKSTQDYLGSDLLFNSEDEVVGLVGLNYNNIRRILGEFDGNIDTLSARLTDESRELNYILRAIPIKDRTKNEIYYLPSCFKYVNHGKTRTILGIDACNARMSAYGEFANNDGYTMKYPQEADNESHNLYIFNNTPAQLGDSATKGVNINGGDHVTVTFLNREEGSTLINQNYPNGINSTLFTGGTVRTKIVEGNKVDSSYSFEGFNKTISDLGIMSEVSNVCRRILQTTIANGGATLVSAIDALSKLQGDRNQPIEKVDTSIIYTLSDGTQLSLQDLITREGNPFVGTLTNDRVLLAFIILIRQVAYLTVTLGEITWLLSFIPKEIYDRNLVVLPLTGEEIAAVEAKYTEQFAKIQALKIRKGELLTELDETLRTTITGHDAFDQFETIIDNIFNYINNSRYINNLDSIDDLQSDLDFSISKIRSPNISNNDKRVYYNKIIGSDLVYSEYTNNLVPRNFSDRNIIQGIQYLKYIAKHSTSDEFNRDGILSRYKYILSTIKPNEKSKIVPLLSAFRFPDIESIVNAIVRIDKETDRQFSSRKENSKINYMALYNTFNTTFIMQGGGSIKNYIVEVFSNEKNEIQKRLSFFLKLKEFLQKGNAAFRKFLLETKHTYSLNQKKDIVKFVLGEKCDYDESILNDMLKNSTKKSIFSPKELARKDVNTRIDFTEKRGEFLNEIRSIVLLLNRDAIFQTADFPVTSISDEQGKAWHLSPVEGSNEDNFLQHYIVVDTDDEPSTDPYVRKEQALNRYIDYTERASIYKLQKEDVEDDEYYEGLVKAAKEAAKEYHGSDKKEIDIYKHIFSSPLDLNEFYDSENAKDIVNAFNIYKDYDSGGYFKGDDPEFTWDERMKIISEEDKKVPTFTRKANNKNKSNANRRREAARAYANETRRLAKAARTTIVPAAPVVPVVPVAAAPIGRPPPFPKGVLASFQKFNSLPQTPIRGIGSDPSSKLGSPTPRKGPGSKTENPSGAVSTLTSPSKGTSKGASKGTSKDASKGTSKDASGPTSEPNSEPNSKPESRRGFLPPPVSRQRALTSENLDGSLRYSLQRSSSPATVQINMRGIEILKVSIDSLEEIKNRTEEEDAELARLKEELAELVNRIQDGGRRRTKRKGNAKRSKRTTQKR